MDDRLKKIIDQTSLKFGLEEYHLETWHFLKRVSEKGSRIYSINMEWLPRQAMDLTEEDTSPEGSVTIEYLLGEARYESIIFVQGKSYSTISLFENKTVEEVASWVEQETGLTLGEDIRLSEIQENGYQFQSAIDGICLSPDTMIEVKFDDEGKLLYFVSYGEGFNKEDITKSAFSLTLEEIEPIVKQQLQLVKLPSEENQKFVSVYAIDEVYVSVADKKIIPYFVHERSEVKVEETVVWDKPSSYELNREEIFLHSEVSVEEAFGELSDNIPMRITKDDIEQSLLLAKDVLSAVFPTDSGKWKVEAIGREERFIQVKCGLVEMDFIGFKRKFIVFIEPTTFKLLNYMDNVELFSVFNSFTPAEKEMVSHAEAYEKMIPYITLDPTYVYDPELQKYVLCGFLDAVEAVDAVTGEIISLRDL
jgi:hypothetical protein